MSSRRGYLTIPELEEYADITVNDATEAFDQISQAEEIIDAYVGFQEKHVPDRIRGEVSAVNGRTLFDTGSGTRLGRLENYFVGCQVSILAGTGAGQSRQIVASSFTASSITVDSDWTVAPDTTSLFEILQLGKFPRHKDAYTTRAGNKWYMSIPEAVKRATAAQVQYFINMGDDFFSTLDSDKTSERIGNYSYTRGSGGGMSQSTLVKLLAPKARTLLRGITNRTGIIVRD